jgi:hypothetical protein
LTDKNPSIGRPAPTLTRRFRVGPLAGGAACSRHLPFWTPRAVRQCAEARVSSRRRGNRRIASRIPRRLRIKSRFLSWLSSACSIKCRKLLIVEISESGHRMLFCVFIETKAWSIIRMSRCWASAPKDAKPSRLLTFGHLLRMYVCLFLPSLPDVALQMYIRIE